MSEPMSDARLEEIIEDAGGPSPVNNSGMMAMCVSEGDWNELLAEVKRLRKELNEADAALEEMEVRYRDASGGDAR